MLRKAHCLLTVFLLVATQVMASEPDAGKSAAALYREAFETLAGMPAQAEELDRKAAPETFSTIERGLDLIREAEQLGSVDWGRGDWEDQGFDTFPHEESGMLRHAIRTGRAYHEKQLGEGDSTRLAGDFGALLALSRAFAEDGVLIHYLVSVAGESILIDLMASNADSIPAEVIHEIQETWENAPPSPTLFDALVQEERGIRGQLWNVLAGVADLPGEEDKEDDESDGWLARLRISSIVSLGGEALRIGFEDETGRSFKLAPGEERHGMRLESVDIAAGRAVVRRGNETAIVVLADRTIQNLDFVSGWRRLTRDAEFPGIDLDQLLEEADYDVGRAFEELLNIINVAYDELRGLAALPYHDFPAEMPKGSNPYSDHRLESAGSVLQTGYRRQALRELFEASLAYHLNPEIGLPVSELTGETIQIRVSSDGTTFESPYRFRDQSLAIEIPSR